MVKIKYLFMTLFISIISASLNAQPAISADHQKQFENEIVEMACKNSTSPACKEKYRSDFLKHQTCGAHLDKIMVENEKEHMQLTDVIKQCDQKFQNEKMKKSCALKQLTEVAENNGAAAEFLANQYAKLKDTKSAEKWNKKTKEISYKKFPECN